MPNSSGGLSVAMIGWDKPIQDASLLSEDRTSYVLYSEEGTRLDLADLIEHLDFARTDYVIIDVDVLREIKDRLRR